MSVKLISYTKGSGDDVTEPQLSPEELIAYTARVSNPNNQFNHETAPKLLGYLQKHKHWSPFEMAHMTIEIKTSRAIAQQILRHRSFSFQEFSQRYAKAMDFVNYEARRQDIKNRQNSIDDMSEEDKQWFKEAQETIQRVCKSSYEAALEKGIAKEQARFLLPLSTETTMYMCGSARSWIHYISLRSDSSTQKEHREVAEGCKNIFCEVFPNIAESLGWIERRNNE